MSKKRSYLSAGVAALVAGLGLVATVLGVGAEASPKSVKAHIRITSQTFSGPGCDSPVGLCAVGQARGTLNGPFEVTATSVVPSSTPGVVFVSATVVFHDRRGDLTCTEDFVYNPSPDADQSFAALCQITGGTGKWEGATGYLQGYGSTPPGETQTSAVLVGRIVLPD